MDLLVDCFALVCGQQAEHTWMPGGDLLPCCQRCTGLYAGASAAMLLHLLIRPRLTNSFLQAHGAFLLLMVPFGYHWIEHGSWIRGITGALFGFGLVTFLQLPLRRPSRGDASASLIHEKRGNRRYFLSAAVITLLIPLVANYGGAATGHALEWAVSVGAITFMALVLGNALYLLPQLAQTVRRVLPTRART